MKRSVLAGCVATGVALLGLASCIDAKTPTEGTTAPHPTTNASPIASDSLDKVSWEGECGAGQVALGFPAPFSIGQVNSRLIEEGTGAVILPGQKVSFALVAYDAATGEMAANTAETGKPETLLLADGNQSSDDPFYLALEGHRVGACMIMALPASQASPDQGGLAATVLALTVLEASTILQRAEGTAVPQTDPNLPQVTLDTEGRPFIKMPSETGPPVELVAQDLIKGSGPPTKLGQDLTVHYASWLWGEDQEFESSWGMMQPAYFTLEADGQLLEGWAKGLAGKRVGSQVLLVVPPERAFGVAGQDDIPPNATLVFVIDILDAA